MRCSRRASCWSSELVVEVDAGGEAMQPAADGCGDNTMQLRDLTAIIILKMAVEVGIDPARVSDARVRRVRASDDHGNIQSGVGLMIDFY